MFAIVSKKQPKWI